MRDLINASSPAVRTQLTEGAFYRGFITIDVVTAATALNPREPAYPFGTTNALEGFIYYTRLSQGSANGLAMVPIENVPATTDSFMTRVLQQRRRPGRDRLDRRASAPTRSPRTLRVRPPVRPGRMTRDIDRFHLRIFRSTPLTGTSRAVIFAWRPGLVGGPSIFCDHQSLRVELHLSPVRPSGQRRAGHHETPRPRGQRDRERLTVRHRGRLDLDFRRAQRRRSTPTSTPSRSTRRIRRANPNLTWDAIFEGYILP